MMMWLLLSAQLAQALPPVDTDDDKDGFSLKEDCDDNNPDINPDAIEIPGDEIDQNCDGDELCFTDTDNDGYRADTEETILSKDIDCQGNGEATVDVPGGDCNDDAAVISPGASEGVGDELDQNCDGIELCFVDADDDGFRTSSNETVESEDEDCTNSGEALNSDPAGDCDDTVTTINPGAIEIVNDGIDNDCDGVSEEAPFGDTASPDTNIPGEAPADDDDSDDKSGCSALPASSGALAGVLLSMTALCRRRQRS